MTTSDIVLTAVTSTTISGMATFFLNYYFEHKQQHRYKKEITNLEHTYSIQLEKLKVEMNISAEVQHEITERRLNNYPKLVELVYRTRNLSRELTNVDQAPAFLDELAARASELNDCLYRFRIDLERDNLFAPIHTYKNVLNNFVIASKDVIHYRSDSSGHKEIQCRLEQVKSIYSQLELLYPAIIKELTKSTTIIK